MRQRPSEPVRYDAGVRIVAAERKNGFLMYPGDLFEHTRAPTYLIPNTSSGTDPEASMRVLEFYQALDHHMTTISDMGAYVPGSAQQRAAFAEALVQIQPYLKRWVVGASIINANAEARGTVTSIKWQFNFPYPVVFHDNMEEAIEWCAKRLVKFL